MAFPPKFKIHLKASNTLFYALDGSGNVYTTATPYALESLPKGWEETEIGIDRSPQNIGLITQVSNSYQFVLDGAKILRYAYHREGVNGRCQIEIYKTDTTTQTYLLYYKGDVDFSGFSDIGDFVEVEVVQGGLNAVLYREADTNRELPLPATPMPVLLDGVALRNKSLVRMTTPVPSANRWMSAVPITKVVKNESDIAPAIIEYETVQVSTTIDVWTDYPVFEAKADGGVTIDYDVTVFVTPALTASPAADFAIEIRHLRGGVTLTTERVYYLPTVSSVGNLIEAKGTRSFNVLTGDTIAIYSLRPNLTVVDPNLFIGMQWAKGIVYFTYNTRQEATTTPSMRYGEVIDALIAEISGNTATVAPNLFTDPLAPRRVDCKLYDLRLSPAEAARGITDAKLKLSWSDIEKDLQRYGLAASADGNTLNIRPVPDFFQNTAIADLGEVSGMQIIPATEYLFANLKTGSKAGENDALQGRYEVNAPEEWAVDGLRVKGDRDMVSPFISGMYAVEQIRGDRIKNTTNTNSDNRILLLEAFDVNVPPAQPFAALTRAQIDPGHYANGLIDTAAEATAFNLSLSPSRDILRNGATVAAQLSYPLLPVYLVFRNAERNGVLMSDLGWGYVAEKQFFTAAMLPSPPFLPVLFKFTAPEPVGLYATLQTNPHGYFSFTYRENSFKGFIDSLTLKPGNDGAMECSLLAHPTTDLSKLVY